MVAANRGAEARHRARARAGRPGRCCLGRTFSPTRWPGRSTEGTGWSWISRGVDYLSSAGLRALDVAAGPGARNGSGSGMFVVCAVPEPVRIALDLAGAASPSADGGRRARRRSRARGGRYRPVSDTSPRCVRGVSDTCPRGVRDVSETPRRCVGHRTFEGRRGLKARRPDARRRMRSHYPPAFGVSFAIHVLTAALLVSLTRPAIRRAVQAGVSSTGTVVVSAATRSGRKQVPKATDRDRCGRTGRIPSRTTGLFHRARRPPADSQHPRLHVRLREDQRPRDVALPVPRPEDVVRTG